MNELKWWFNVKRLEFMMYRHSRKARNFAHRNDHEKFSIHRKIAGLYAEEMFKQYQEGLK